MLVAAEQMYVDEMLDRLEGWLRCSREASHIGADTSGTGDLSNDVAYSKIMVNIAEVYQTEKAPGRAIVTKDRVEEEKMLAAWLGAFPRIKFFKSRFRYLAVT